MVTIELPVHCGFDESRSCLSGAVGKGYSDGMSSDRGFDYMEMRSPNEVGDVGIIDAGVIRKRNYNAAANAAEKIRTVAGNNKIAFIASGRGAMRDLPYLMAVLNDMGMSFAWTKTEHSEDYSGGYRHNRRLAKRREYHQMIEESDVVVPFDDKAGYRSTGKSVAGVLLYALRSIKGKKMVVPVLNIDCQGIVPIAQFEMYRNENYMGPVKLLRKTLDKQVVDGLDGVADMVFEDRVNGGNVAIYDDSQERKVMSYRDALAYSIACFSSQDSGKSRYPVKQLTELKEMLDGFLEEKIHNG